jgi:hypothetical protein
VMKAVWKLRAQLVPVVAAAWFALVGVPSLAAQQMPHASPASSSADEETLTITVQIEPPPIMIPSGSIGASAPLGAQALEGNPMMAEFVTESHQTAKDGASITCSTNSVIYRDSQGRVRRESHLLVPGLPSGVTAKFITIDDRRQGFGWVLDPQALVAHRYRLNDADPSYVARLSAQGSGQLLPPAGKGSADSGENATAKSAAESRRWLPRAFSTPPVALRQEAPEAMSSGPPESGVAPAEENGFNGVRRPFVAAPNPVRTENLGEQMILGYRTFGTRVITTLQPGETGNDAPIDIVSEQWFSPELGLVMRSLHRDPWGGEFTTTVASVRRGEQPSQLFSVPADYTLIDADREDERHVFVNGREMSIGSR